MTRERAEDECLSIGEAYDVGYKQALEDLWELAINKFDEAMDFTDLDECIEELKKR